MTPALGGYHDCAGHDDGLVELGRQRVLDRPRHERSAAHVGQQLVVVGDRTACLRPRRARRRRRHSRSRVRRSPLRNLRAPHRDASAQRERADAHPWHARDRSLSGFTLYCFEPITAMPLSSTGRPSGTTPRRRRQKRDHVDSRLVADDLRVAEIDLDAAETTRPRAGGRRAATVRARFSPESTPTAHRRGELACGAVRFEDRGQRRGDGDQLGAVLARRARLRLPRRSRRATAGLPPCGGAEPLWPGRALRQ